MQRSHKEKSGRYALAIDQGTTGSTALLVDLDSFLIVDKRDQDFAQIYPTPGWVEHDLNVIWGTVRHTVSLLLSENKIDPKDILCIGITNQRETACLFDNLGRPLSNAIVWQDRRTTSFCEELKKEGKEAYIKEKTGLTIDPYFTATKLRWFTQNVPMANVRKEDFRCGTIDTFLLFKLTGHKSFATEASNASRTLLMDLKKGEWDDELFSLFAVSRDCMPEIKDSFTGFGHTQGLDFLPDGIPITGILGDQQAALLGQAGINPGNIKCTYGTGAFMLLNTGDQVPSSKKGLLSTVFYQHQGKRTYALEGSCYIAGAVVQWLRDNLHLFPESADIERLAREVTNLEETRHVFFFPFFTGIGSPYWRPEAKGAITGLTRDTKEKHLARAALEGMALSINDLFQTFRSESPSAIPSFHVDGGAAANDLLMQIQSDFSQIEIKRPRVIETTGYGAALAAAIGAGYLEMSRINDFWKLDQSFHPRPSLPAGYYGDKAKQWTETIRRLFL